MYISAWKRLALCLACVGMILPQGAAFASDAVSRSTDIGLRAGGTLTGSVVDSQGKPLVGSPVVVLFNGMPIARTQTNAQGTFAVQSLRGGVHEIRSTKGRTIARLWAPNTAPQSAKTAAVVVASDNIVRAQCADGGCTSGAVGVIGEGCADGSCGAGGMVGGGGFGSGAGFGGGGA